MSVDKKNKSKSNQTSNFWQLWFQMRSQEMSLNFISLEASGAPNSSLVEVKLCLKTVKVSQCRFVALSSSPWSLLGLSPHILKDGGKQEQSQGYWCPHTGMRSPSEHRDKQAKMMSVSNFKHWPKKIKQCALFFLFFLSYEMIWIFWYFLRFRQ